MPGAHHPWGRRFTRPRGGTEGTSMIKVLVPFVSLGLGEYKTPREAGHLEHKPSY